MHVCNLFLVQNKVPLKDSISPRPCPPSPAPTSVPLANIYFASVLHDLPAYFYANTSQFKYTFVSPRFFPKSYLIINTVLHFAFSRNNISWSSLIRQLKTIRKQANPALLCSVSALSLRICVVADHLRQRRTLGTWADFQK